MASGRASRLHTKRSKLYNNVTALGSAGHSTELQHHITAESLRAKLNLLQASLTSRRIRHVLEAGKVINMGPLPHSCGAPHMYIMVTARPRRLSFSNAQVN